MLHHRLEHNMRAI